MNAQPVQASERGLILLIAVGLLTSGGILFATRPRPSASLSNVPIVLENVTVIRPTFHDARKIDPNAASVEELVRLPGIGEVLAGRIIAHREEHGNFASIDGLLAVNGIGPVVLEKIRELVEIDPAGGRSSADQ